MVITVMPKVALQQEVALYHPLVTANAPLLAQVSPKTGFRRILHKRVIQRGGQSMRFSVRNVIPLLVFILSTVSVFRFLRITIIANQSAPRPHDDLHLLNQRECSSPPTTCRKNILHSQAPLNNHLTSVDPSNLTEKEMAFLLEFFSRIVPCNLLIFGLEYQYSSITSLNAGGVTVVLEDYQRDISITKSINNVKVHKIMYNTVASEAYKLLKYARVSQDCVPKSHLQKESKCNLVLSNLPQEVYETQWDVVMVDGPSGDTPTSPGKMATIYTAGIIARSRNMTHVLVHNVDRMIEKWFSWDFLCDKNLVSSKGRIWHFQILGLANATTFCAT